MSKVDFDYRHIISKQIGSKSKLKSIISTTAGVKKQENGIVVYRQQHGFRLPACVPRRELKTGVGELKTSGGELEETGKISA